jgi:flagellar hook assembly protein FlgD
VTTPVGWQASHGTNPTNDRRTGNRSWQLDGTASLGQSVEQLPNGSYTLSVWAKSSGAGAQLSVKNHGGADKSAAIPAATSWTRVTLGDIVVSSGKADVGVTSDGPTVKLDDFEMILTP